jgi:thiosulfate/3-mercaptopyruvate sulfurtransferase
VTDVTRDELMLRLDEPGLTLLDVRTLGEYDGSAGYPCDARQGHISGARHVDLHDILAAGDSAAIRTLLGLPEGAEVIAYCHSGGRSAIAAQVLAAAGYDARNYVGSWHEWSADASLPIELRPGDA